MDQSKENPGTVLVMEWYKNLMCSLYVYLDTAPNNIRRVDRHVAILNLAVNSKFLSWLIISSDQQP